MKFIKSWLVKEEALGISDNFLCNWRLTEECHREGRLLVFVDGDSGNPVAYQWGGLIRPGILQVRHDMRGKGIGRKLVARCVADAYGAGEYLLFIECNPSSSIPFWQAMGFTLINLGDRKGQAFRILHKPLPLPRDAQIVAAVVRFYPESRKWDQTVCPLAFATPVAACTSDGEVYFSERVFFFEALYPDARDVVIEVEIDGELWLREKAKYEAAARVGVRRCTNGYYIDRLLPVNGRNESSR